MRYFSRSYLIKVLFLMMICFRTVQALDTSFFENNKDVRLFIDQMVQKYGFSRQELRRDFQKAHLEPKVLAHIQKPFEKKPWYFYRHHFVTTERIQGGVVFSKQYQAALA